MAWNLHYTSLSKPESFTSSKLEKFEPARALGTFEQETSPTLIASKWRQSSVTSFFCSETPPNVFLNSVRSSEDGLPQIRPRFRRFRNFLRPIWTSYIAAATLKCIAIDPPAMHFSVRQLRKGDIHVFVLARSNKRLGWQSPNASGYCVLIEY